MGFRSNVFITVLGLIACDGRAYTNYTLFLGLPSNKQELEFYKNLKIEYDVIFWQEPVALFKAVEFMVDPEQLEDFRTDAKENNISMSLLMRDVQSAFDKQTAKPYFRAQLETFDWKGFYRLDSIYTWLKDLQQANPNIMKMEIIGCSSEVRPIYAVKLKYLTTESLPKVIVEGGIHAREWISPAFVTYLINELVNATRSGNEDLKRIALAYEWLIVPVLNPDGYEYTHTTDRMWRKNRRSGYGVDLNRNFGSNFGTVGVEHKMTSEVYCGDTKFSEPETRAMVHFLDANKDNLTYYLAFHSFGQYFIIPYYYSSKHLDNFDQVKKMAEQAMVKLRLRHGIKYEIGTAHDTVGYLVSGGSSCWAKRHYGIPYVATMELRDKGVYGFALPPEQILPTCLETMDGLYSFLQPPASNPPQPQTQPEPLRAPLALHSGKRRPMLSRFVIVFMFLLDLVNLMCFLN